MTHPATMTHSAVPEADRQRIGVTGGLVLACDDLYGGTWRLRGNLRSARAARAR